MATKTVGDMIDQVAGLKDQITALTKQADDLKKERVTIENEILEFLENQGIESTAGSAYTASRIEETVYNISDFEALTQYIVDNRAPYVFQRRLSTVAIRDLISERPDGTLPGLEPVQLTKLSFRKRSK